MSRHGQQYHYQGSWFRAIGKYLCGNWAAGDFGLRGYQESSDIGCEKQRRPIQRIFRRGNIICVGVDDNPPQNSDKRSSNFDLCSLSVRNININCIVLSEFLNLRFIRELSPSRPLIFVIVNYFRLPKAVAGRHVCMRNARNGSPLVGCQNSFRVMLEAMEIKAWPIDDERHDNKHETEKER